MGDVLRSVTDELLENAEAYPQRYGATERSPRPARHICVVACMDARLHLFDILGLNPGDAHIIRNAGGLVTQDVIRSLVVSQRALGTEEIVIIQHTDCGLQKLNEREFFGALQEEVGYTPDWSLHDFEDVKQNVRSSIARLRNDPFLVHTDRIRGFVFDVDKGNLEEVL